MRDEFFGSDDQRAVLRRGRGLAALLGQDRRYSYYGRTVGLPGPEDGDIDHLAALAIVQGNTNYGTVPLGQVQAVKQYPANRDLALQRNAEEQALDAAARIIAHKFISALEESY